LFLGSLIGVVLVEVFREGEITFHRIQGAIAGYLLLGILWTVAYRLVYVLKPDAFQLGPYSLPRAVSEVGLMSEFMYFSFATITTVGYGGVIAVHPSALSLVMLEALVGQLFPAILLARLVSMEVSSRKDRPKENRPEKSGPQR
jgi:Ion channel